MWKLRIFFFYFAAFAAAAQPSSKKPSLWQTLRGDAPLVIAHGGFSGLFPGSSSLAYALALQTGLPNTILWCDVQLTSDGFGVCLPDLLLNNGSNTGDVFANKNRTYLVNGISTTGYFSVDFTLKDLSNVSVTQGIYSRTYQFDQNFFPVMTIQELSQQFKPPGLWLNIQHAAFFDQHKLKTRSFVLSTTRSSIVNYISSPEVNFLKSIVARLRATPTKLVFRFLGKNEFEPSTNQTYDSLLKNLKFIKTFASGILVPKSYIWPVDQKLNLQPSTSVVLDAHKEGLEIYAADFSNDVSIAYDFSYDPVAEYLKFIDNGNFSVDGVLSDFPITPSAAIDCYSHMDKNDSRPVKPLVITNEGASGDYPGCTDLAYKTAITDGADILDCPVQMTKDGVPICLGSINLIDRTNAVHVYSTTTDIPELGGAGIFSFNLTWQEIQKLKPEIYNPFADDAKLYRNQNNKNKGQLLSLSDFLALAYNATSVSGVVIRIEEASFLAEQGLDVTDAVLDALSKNGYDNQKVKRVMIQSSDSAVLIKIKEKRNFEFVYEVDEIIRDVLNSTMLDIKKLADSVVIDAHVELNSFVVGADIDGVITDFPKTANLYRRNRCLGLGEKAPIYMSPVAPGSLVTVVLPQPPAEAPSPILSVSDVLEPPLPSVAPTSSIVENKNATAALPPASQPNGQSKLVLGVLLTNLPLLLSTILLF
ncbi:Glycerophosphodiester phosphodiesterase [Heracleum sosnowskyi]|uniref:glycerophosphodiester phosphodiesterase n=1 Tax=Heracleum sosnowskyi TaxID=360622 RepID=A0AAD8JN96_9APIA|nr:Glycerophosphodiester phosphodiesterase [Heracleum sosnowskyi]